MRRSGSYGLAVHRSAVAFAGLALVVHYALGHWGGAALWAACGAAIGFCLARFVSPLERVFSLPSELTAQVQLSAAAAFVEHNVMATAKRTGVLLYISLLEHRVTVLADTGIYGRANAGVWNEVCALVTDGIRSGNPTAGIIAAIERLAALLREHGNLIESGDKNELPNRVRGDST